MLIPTQPESPCSPFFDRFADDLHVMFEPVSLICIRANVRSQTSWESIAVLVEKRIFWWGEWNLINFFDFMGENIKIYLNEKMLHFSWKFNQRGLSKKKAEIFFGCCWLKMAKWLNFNFIGMIFLESIFGSFFLFPFIYLHLFLFLSSLGGWPLT